MKRSKRSSGLPRPRRIKILSTTGKSSTASENDSSKSYAEVERILTILDLLWRRNRNQHRNQRWWKPIANLRKGLRKIHQAYQCEHASAKQMNSAEEVRLQFQQETEAIRTREKWEIWLRDVVVPQTYANGIGLITNDIQFAGLALVLTALVAEIARLVGYPDSIEQSQKLGQDEFSNAVVHSVTATSLNVTGQQAGRTIDRTFGLGDDFGEVIKRRSDEIVKGGEVEPKSELRSTLVKQEQAKSDFSLPVDTGEIMLDVEERLPPRSKVRSQDESPSAILEHLNSNPTSSVDTSKTKAMESGKRQVVSKDKVKGDKGKRKKKQNVIDDLFAGFD